jgi:hypothetical protein
MFLNSHSVGPDDLGTPRMERRRINGDYLYRAFLGAVFVCLQERRVSVESRISRSISMIIENTEIAAKVNELLHVFGRVHHRQAGNPLSGTGA